MRAIYAGSFDPITLGHMDIIERACSATDSLVVGVAIANTKDSLFSVNERVDLINQSIADTPYREKIEVVAFDGLLIELAKRENANVLIRGLRAVADFEYEFQMAMMNRALAQDVETMFLMAAASKQFVSSRFVKEIHRLGGEIHKFVPEPIIYALDNKRDA